MSPNGQYDSICPQLTSRQCQVGGQFFPNKPINDMQRPSEGYQYLIQALTQGGGVRKSFGTNIYRYNYCVNLNAVANSDSTFVIPANGARAAHNGANDANGIIVSYPNSFYCGYDLEKSAGIIFQGVNTRASPPFLNLFKSTATSAGVTVNVNAWGMSDVILQVDPMAKQITAFI